MKFEVDKIYLIGAIDTTKDIVVDYREYTSSNANYANLFLVNTDAPEDDWPMTFHFTKNLYRIRPEGFYKYKKYIIFANYKEIENYNKNSHYTIRKEREINWERRHKR